MIAGIDRNDTDESITPERWQFVNLKLSGNFLPITSDVGWHQGYAKFTACANQRFLDISTKAIGGLGEIWPGAKLEAVPKEDILSRPKTRTWIPAEPPSGSV